MASKNRFIITLQAADGSSPPFSYDITKSKAEKVVDLIKDDIGKKKKKMATATATLDRFFNDNN